MNCFFLNGFSSFEPNCTCALKICYRFAQVILCCVPSFCAHEHGFVGPILGNRSCSSTASVTHPVPDQAVVHLPAPPCLPSCVAHPSFPLALCSLLGWLILCGFYLCTVWGDTHHQEPVGDPVLRSPAGWGSLPGDTGSFWGKNTWGCAQGESTKGGERWGLGEEEAWKTRGKWYKRGWSHVNKWLVSACVCPGCKCGLSLSQYHISDSSWCAWLHTYMSVRCMNMCACALLGTHVEPGFCLGMGTRIFSSLPSSGHQICQALTPPASLCYPGRDQELWLVYENGVHGCLVTLRLGRVNLGFVHFCLVEVLSASGKMSGFTYAEIRGN